MSAPGDAAGVALTEPARQRLIMIAADVLGRLPPDQVPASLRTIAKFTPTRRARLGGPSLAAALDADDDFRHQVAEVVAEASPQLADAVRERTATTASDPIDTAVVAYLLRPDGWAEVVADANARWIGEQGDQAKDSPELERLGAEVAALRARAKSEPSRLRAAVAESTAHLDAEIVELRRRLRAAAAELRSSERDRDQLAAVLAEAERASAAASSAQEAELRRMRSRMSELERAATSARRSARADRDVDDARLWLLVDTLSEAVAGIRRELSLAPSPVRPADAVASTSSSASAPTRRTDDPAALDGLLALPNVHVIVDGYNVTKTGYPELSLADQRSRLIGALASLAARTGAETTIAFDGGVKPPAQPRTPRGIRVLFSAPDEIADDLIRRLVAAEPEGRPLVVVTSDQQIVTDVQRAGAWAVPSPVLLARLS